MAHILRPSAPRRLYLFGWVLFLLVSEGMNGVTELDLFSASFFTGPMWEKAVAKRVRRAYFSRVFEPITRSPGQFRGTGRTPR